MAMSLGFHDHIFLCRDGNAFSNGVLTLQIFNNQRRSLQRSYKALSKGVAILFATGAVSGTMLSFELGLLWPKFMEHAGPIFGMPFSWKELPFSLRQ
jgi:cytochrome d ubiquinol oxidase subunit I